MTYDSIKKALAEPQNGNGDIYWAEEKTIEELKAADKPLHQTHLKSE